MPSIPLPSQLTNPFSARRLDPRSTEYAVVEPSLLGRCAQQVSRARGAWIVVGKHGSGKSALVAAVAAALREPPTSWQTRWINADRMPYRETRQLNRSNGAQLIVVDGLDRWTPRQRRQWRRHVLARGACCIGTSHTRLAGWRILCQTTSTPERLKAIVDRLLQDAPGNRYPPPALVASLFNDYAGNLRDVLFDLYDWWEWQAGGHTDTRTLSPVLRRALGSSGMLAGSGKPS